MRALRNVPVFRRLYPVLFLSLFFVWADFTAQWTCGAQELSEAEYLAGYRPTTQQYKDAWRVASQRLTSGTTIELINRYDFAVRNASKFPLLVSIAGSAPLLIAPDGETLFDRKLIRSGARLTMDLPPDFYKNRRRFLGWCRENAEKRIEASRLSAALWDKSHGPDHDQNVQEIADNFKSIIGELEKGARRDLDNQPGTERRVDPYTGIEYEVDTSPGFGDYMDVSVMGAFAKMLIQQHANAAKRPDYERLVGLLEEHIKESERLIEELDHVLRSCSGEDAHAQTMFSPREISDSGENMLPMSGRFTVAYYTSTGAEGYSPDWGEDKQNHNNYLEFGASIAPELQIGAWRRAAFARLDAVAGLHYLSASITADKQPVSWDEAPLNAPESLLLAYPGLSGGARLRLNMNGILVTAGGGVAVYGRGRTSVWLLSEATNNTVVEGAEDSSWQFRAVTVPDALRPLPYWNLAVGFTGQGRSDRSSRFIWGVAATFLHRQLPIQTPLAAYTFETSDGQALKPPSGGGHNTIGLMVMFTPKRR